MSDTAHPSPHRARVGLPILLFGLCAAPVFWIAQIVLGYVASAVVCYPGNHPVVVAPGNPVGDLIVVFDIAAVLGAVSGGIASFMSWRAVGEEMKGGAHRAIEIGEGRARFMALCGICISGGFLLAIVFNIIATTLVPLCPR